MTPLSEQLEVLAIDLAVLAVSLKEPKLNEHAIKMQELVPGIERLQRIEKAADAVLEENAFAVLGPMGELHEAMKP